jgi:hypothetical protein
MTWLSGPAAVRLSPGAEGRGRQVRCSQVDTEMALSVHDNLLISYEVQCEARLITLRTEFRAENKPTEFTNIVFKGVQGYSFEK